MNLLELRLHRLCGLAEHYVKLRTATFSVTLLSGIAVALTPGSSNRYLIPFLGFLIYLWTVHVHNRIAQALLKTEIRKKLFALQSAKSKLHWSEIPKPPLLAGPSQTEPKKLPNSFFDLDLLEGQSLLRLLNSTQSTAGLARLIHFLDSNGINDVEILRRQQLTKELEQVRVLRKKFLVTASTHPDPIDSEQLLLLLNSALHTPRARAYFIGILVTQIFTLTAFIPFFFFGTAPFFLAPLLTLILLYKAGWKEIQLGEAFDRALSLELSLQKFSALSKVLTQISGTAFPGLKNLLRSYAADQSPHSELKKLNRVVGFLGVRQNPVMHLLINSFCPWDFFWTFRLEKLRLTLKARFPIWLESLAEFETFVSLSEFAETFSNYRFPTFLSAQDTSKTDLFLGAKDLGHPLVNPAKRVVNDLRLTRQERCHIITGSNMSGKSTFLRTLGINLVLAKTGTVVAAGSFQFRNLTLLTSLRPLDSLEDGLSSFYAEVKQLKAILDGTPEEASHASPSLYLIDEIFKGTNNRERLAGSRAFIKRLVTRSGCGLVATHDLELAGLEASNDGIRNFHFKEDFEGQQMTFSYKISKGPCPTTNALKVMELAGLPLDAISN